MAGNRGIRTAIALVLLVGALIVGAGSGSSSPPATPAASGMNDTEAITDQVTQGALRVQKADGEVVECPLKHTDVEADISGFIARVKVTQTFFNPLDEKIEAVYVFPLPHQSAVDDMTMIIGGRRIVGVIKRRQAARIIYEQALARGQTAALLEQERPNVFTQSVGNIGPKQEVRIEISYVDVLKYDMGTYEFHFPMVVGPRYIPGTPASTIPPVPLELKGKVGELDRTKVIEGSDEPTGTGWAPDTDRVPDASRITPPVLKPGYRNGHDIALSVNLEAGVPVQDLKSTNHLAEIGRPTGSAATVVLSPEDAIPNKDFVLRYGVVGEKPEMAVLGHKQLHPGIAGNWDGLDDTGYFMLMIQPGEDERLTKSPPREICFLIDVSGSMSGEPTAKVRDAMEGFLASCKDHDTVQVITFAGRASKLFEKAVPVTKGNINRALDFTRNIRSGGGTEMLKGIKMAINDPLDEKRVRIVILLTDGYIGNEAEIIAEVGRRCGDQIRFWCVGIGSSPNQFLIDGVARQGGGMSKILGLNDDPTEMVQEVMFRIHRAQLANVAIDWGDMAVSETFPAKIPELWAGRPIIIFGRYDGGGRTAIRVTGTVEGEPASWPLTVAFPTRQDANAVLAKVWARNKIEDLMHQTYYQGSPLVEELVTQIALDYRLMSQYTSFVAVDESELDDMVEPARPPRRMLVPVPIPEGTRYEGFFGEACDEEEFALDIGGLGAIPSASTFGYVARFGGRVGGGARGKRRLSSTAVISGGALNAPMRLSTRLPFARGTWDIPTARAELAEARFMPSRGRPGLSGYGAFRSFALASPPVSAGLALVDVDGAVPAELQHTDAEAAVWSVAQQAVYEYAETMLTHAAKVMEKAKALAKEGDLAAARAGFTLAWLVDATCAAFGRSDGRIGDVALEEIEKLDRRLIESRASELPALKTKLDLVIRDRSIADALRDIGRAAGVRIELISGSLEDARALMGRKDLRVTYLDLRRATVAQALDWILRPVRMTWWLRGDGIACGTARRGPGASAWVYDVGHLALPCAREVEGIKERDKLAQLVQSSTDAFLDAVRTQLTLAHEDAMWFGPGQLLLYADADKHAAAAELFARLADPQTAFSGKLAELHNLTGKRAEGSEKLRVSLVALRERALVQRTLYAHSWRLLAGASRARLDLEALTELRIAWNRPEMAELLQGAGALTALRSLWAVTESARALPEERELASLASFVRETSRAAVGDALASLAKSPEDVRAFFKVLYASLALADDGAFRAKAGALLLGNGAGSSQVDDARILAAALLSPVGTTDVGPLVELVSKGVAGDDMVALTAIACRRVGGEAWRVFRSEAQELLGRQPLAGSVVILVNSLSATPLAIAAGGGT